MSLPPLVLVGAGGHAKSCIDVIEQEGRHVIAGLVGLQDERGTQVLGYPVFAVDDELHSLVAGGYRALVTVGHLRTPDARMRLFAALVGYGYDLPVIVSPRAYVSRHATIGAGTIVMHGAIVNAGAAVGRDCILNSQSLVEHDARIGDHCHVSTGAVINGGAQVGDGTFVGSGTVVRNDIVLGERCLIGMGQRVLANCEAGTRMPQPKAQP